MIKKQTKKNLKSASEQVKKSVRPNVKTKNKVTPKTKTTTKVTPAERAKLGQKIKPVAKLPQATKTNPVAKLPSVAKLPPVAKSITKPAVSLTEKNINYVFRNKELLQEAITHKSYSIERSKNALVFNERLEYLGDAVLDLVISEMLFRQYPEDAEGPLSQRRAALVSEESLANMALKLQLDTEVLLGKGERQLGGHRKSRLLACLFEAILGAVYLDSSYAEVFAVIHGLFNEQLQNLGDASMYRKDYKTRLQEEIQKKIAQTPTYVVEVEEGPAHDRTFQISVRLGNRVLGRGEGKTKKQAEQIAARQALEGKTYES